jgi:light-regulated signal transduction histidine kinase (bacteriophytochrome)
MDELSNLAEVGRQPLAFDRIQLSAIVEDVVTKLGQESEGRRMDWKIGELPEVECDGILFRQVFQNLIGNAVKFSRPRSSAVIEIGQMEKDGTRVIFVKDNGVGFDMGYADRLFNVFQRLHSPLEFEGAGVGLAVVKRIVQKHGGRIWAESAPDCGATFYFTWEHAKIPVSRVPPLRAEVNQ